MTEQEKRSFFTDYNKKMHIYGRLGLIIASIMLFSMPFAMGAYLGAMPDLKGFLRGLLQVAPIYMPSSIVEFLIFAPMLGAGASYLAFITGNLTNLKIPCAINARDIAKTEVGTPENEIISTLSVATSSLVTTTILALGVLMLTPLTPILSNPVLEPAFNNVVPALFGALGFKYFSKGLKIAILPLILMSILCVFIPSVIGSVGFLVIPSGAIAILTAYILFKNNKL